jgi:hypothetical protein
MDGHREVIGVAEGMKEDAASWRAFVSSLLERGPAGVRMAAGGRCAGLVSTVGGLLSEARYQWCMVHVMHNVLSKAGPRHNRWIAGALKAVFATEPRESALARAKTVAAGMEERKTQGGRHMPQGGHRRNHHIPARRAPGRTSQAHPHRHHDRTIEPGEPMPNPRGGRVPRRQERPEARHRTDSPRDVQRLVHPAPPGHVPARRHHERSEPKTHAERQNRKCARLQALPVFSDMVPYLAFQSRFPCQATENRTQATSLAHLKHEAPTHSRKNPDVIDLQQ